MKTIKDLSPIIKLTKELLNDEFPEYVIEDAVLHQFKHVRNWTAQPHIPAVSLNNFGTFYIKTKVLRHRILEKFIPEYKAGKIDKETLQKWLKVMDECRQYDASKIIPNNARAPKLRDRRTKASQRGDDDELSSSSS